MDGREFLFFQERRMDAWLRWIAMILSLVYGLLTAFAGLSQFRHKNIQAWAAWGLLVFGLLVATGGLLLLLSPGLSLPVMVVGLVGIHLLAINNGLKIFGKINPSHHLFRLLVSLTLLGLALLGLR
jgi:hypothetical protein